MRTLRPECADLPLLTDAEDAGRTTARRSILRPYATAGVAIVGAGLVAVTPLAAPLPSIHTVTSVALAADGSPLGDLLDPWLRILGTSSDNVNTLVQSYYLAPNVAFQQLMANLSGYAQQVIDDPANLTQVANDMQQDWRAAMSAITLMNADQDTVDAVIRHTMDGDAYGGHSTVFGQIGGYLPPDQADSIMPIINFLASPMSGIVMGMLGPGISPWVALLNSIIDGDSFGQIMASPLDGFLNGATLDLTSLTPFINDLGLFPSPMAMSSLEIAFGGLLSPGGNVIASPLHVVNEVGADVGQVPAVGGSIFNSVGLTFTGLPVVGTLSLQSDPVGPLAAWEALSQVIAMQLGWGSWIADFSGGGTYEVPAMPPGTDISFPTDFGDFFSDFFPAGGLDG